MSRSTSDSRLVSGGAGRPGTGYSCSPETRSAIRVVTRHARCRAAPQQVSDDRARSDDLLEVVEDQQHPLLADVSARVSMAGRLRLSATPSIRAIVAATSAGSRTGSSATNQIPSGNSSAAAAATCSESRVLPVPPGPVRVSSRVPASNATGLVELLVAADERRELGRQVVRPGVERSQWREIVREAVDDELGEALGGAQVLQSVLAEIAEGDAVGQGPGDEAARVGR